MQEINEEWDYEHPGGHDDNAPIQHSELNDDEALARALAASMDEGTS